VNQHLSAANAANAANPGVNVRVIGVIRGQKLATNKKHCPSDSVKHNPTGRIQLVE